MVAEAAMAEQQRQFAEASERVAGGPGETEILSVIAEAERLAKQREQADDELTRAEKDHADARDQRQEVDRRADRARTALDTVRDRIASLGPPAPDRQHVSAAWQQLNAWTRGERQAALDGRLGADTERRRVATASDELERRLRTAVGEQLTPGNGPISALREMLVQERADAAASLGRFDAERRRLEELRARVRSLREDAAVADSLGRLLSATGFESWLMAAALEELCSRATTRLHALSGGQYSLVLDDREFLVRDHHNADELRNVRTLSGGETFLASLALALALAEATAELAPAGAPTIESIFLDEGFGTLDTDTLETVAGAIEELGASGRMVAVVTHIRELADRMPVRLEVTKRPGGASVARVDV